MDRLHHFPHRGRSGFFFLWRWGTGHRCAARTDLAHHSPGGRDRSDFRLGALSRGDRRPHDQWHLRRGLIVEAGGRRRLWRTCRQRGGPAHSQPAATLRAFAVVDGHWIPVCLSGSVRGSVDEPSCGTAGNRITKRFPRSCPGSRVMLPPLASTAHFAMASPRPLPPASREREASIRKNLSKTFCLRSSAIVSPLSSTAMSTVSECETWM